MPKLKQYITKPIAKHYESEKEFSSACRRVFKGEGLKVLEQLLIDYNYHIPDSYSLHQTTYSKMSWEDFLKYRAAQKEVLSHLLFACNAEYEEVKQNETLTNEEDYD